MKVSLPTERVRSLERARDYFTQVTDSVIASLREIECQLVAMDALLDRLQPPHTGRIRVMWVSRGKSRGYEGEKVPQAVKWMRHRLASTWRAVRLPRAGLTLRAKVTGDFEGNAARVRAALADLQMLLELHAQTRGRLAKLDGNWAKAQPQVTRRLKAVGQRSEQSRLAEHG